MHLGPFVIVNPENPSPVEEPPPGAEPPPGTATGVKKKCKKGSKPNKKGKCVKKRKRKRSAEPNANAPAPFGAVLSWLFSDSSQR